MHAHTKDLAIATLDDAAKPNQPAGFRPDRSARLSSSSGDHVHVDWFAVPSGSPEMADLIPKRLADHPATVIQGHGTFVRGRTLKEAFFLVCVANNAGAGRPAGPDAGGRCRGAAGAGSQADPAGHFRLSARSYAVEDDDVCDFPEETEILKEFRKAGARIFESRLSPFHTGSMSVRGVGDLLYAPKASMPREIGGPLLKVPLAGRRGRLARARRSTRRSTPRPIFRRSCTAGLPRPKPTPISAIPGRASPPTGSSRSTPRGASCISSSPSFRPRPTRRR